MNNTSSDTLEPPEQQLVFRHESQMSLPFYPQETWKKCLILKLETVLMILTWNKKYEIGKKKFITVLISCLVDIWYLVGNMKQCNRAEKIKLINSVFNRYTYSPLLKYETHWIPELIVCGQRISFSEIYSFAFKMLCLDFSVSETYFKIRMTCASPPVAAFAIAVSVVGIIVLVQFQQKNSWWDGNLKVKRIGNR